MTNESGRPKDGDDPERTDAAFEAIVSSLRDDDSPEKAAWPESEDVDPTSQHRPPETPERHPSPLGSAWTGWEDLAVPDKDVDPDFEKDEYDDDDEAEHHYVPPAPPPLPKGDRILRWAWAGALGSPALLALFFALGWNISDMTALLLVVTFLAGFVTLVSRMRPGRSDDDPDDGAVV